MSPAGGSGTLRDGSGSLPDAASAGGVERGPMSADPTREPSDGTATTPGDPGSPPPGSPGSPPPGDGWSPPAGSAPPLVAPPLQRRSDRRVVAGVCSGVAYRLGVDPTLVRVVVVALSFLGGAGILLYALGWLLLPEDTSGRSLADRALRGDGSNPQTVLLAVGLGLVVVLITFGVLRETWFGLTLLALVVVAGVVLLSRRSAAPPATPPAPPGWQPAAPSAAAPTQPGYGPSPSSYPGAPTARSTSPDPSYEDYVAGYPYGPEPTVPPAPEPERPRSYLGALTFFAAVLAVGVVGLVDALGASVPLSAYLATALGVTGLGLVVGAWFGRSRGLVALGVGLAFVLVPVATLERADISGLDEAFVQDTIEPTSARAIDGRTFEHGVGDITYDLSEIDFTDRSADLTIQMGSGNLQVTVPDEVAVELDARVGMGQVDAFGSASSGVGVSRTQDYPGEADGGTLRLDIEMGFGNVEVDRAAA